MPTSTHRRTPWFILSAAAIFYLFLFPRFDVGHFQDDSRHIAAAQSLLQGHYRALYDPDHPTIFAALPGYPLWLAPWVAIVQPHWALLKFVSIAMSLLAGLALWRWAGCWTSKPTAALALILFAFNPSVVYFSSAVLTELCFLFFTLAVLISFELLLKTGSAGRWSAWGLLLGWAALMRPEGFALWLAFGAALIWRRRWTACLYGIGVAVIVWSLGELQVNGLSNYMDVWLHTFHASGGIKLASPGAAVISDLLTQAAVPLPFAARSSFETTLYGIAGCLIGLLLLQGIRIFWKAAGLSKESKTALIAFMTMSLGMDSLWTAYSLRHLVPVTAFVLVFLSVGAMDLWRRTGRRRVLIATAGIMALICYAYQNIHAAREAVHPPVENYVWRETFSWIGKNTAADDRFFAFRAPMLYLYTGRQAYSELTAGDAYRFRYEVLRRDVRYVAYEPLQVSVVQPVGSSRGSFWPRAEEWLNAWPAAFPIAYDNHEEHVTIYNVVPDPRYREAYDLYLSARRDGEEGRWKESEAKLRKADALCPHLAPVENARGLAAWQGRGDRRLAEYYFRAALKNGPSYGVAADNLSRLLATHTH